MKGQVFILTAFIICMMLAELGNIYTYSDLPSKTEQTKIDEGVDIVRNIQNEINFTDSVNESDDGMLVDFILYVGNFSLQKNYVVNISTYSG